MNLQQFERAHGQQGRYLGAVQPLCPADRAKVKKVRAEKGFMLRRYSCTAALFNGPELRVRQMDLDRSEEIFSGRGFITLSAWLSR